MNDEPIFDIKLWEDDEYILTYNGEPVGNTMSKQTALTRLDFLQGDTFRDIFQAAQNKLIDDALATVEDLYNPEITDLELAAYHHDEEPVIYLKSVRQLLKRLRSGDK